MLAAVAVASLQGCNSTRHTGEQAPIARGAVPAYADVAAAYNARVQRLERLSSSIGVVVRAKNAEGNPLREQVEGNLQVALPANVAMRLDKVETLFYLGSNDTKYWWFDLTGDKTALVGRHDRATPETVASFGLPVHPLDLLEVLAVKPIPNAGGNDATHAQLAWSNDGHWLMLTLPGRWSGQRRFTLDPKTCDPSRIELLDRAGRTVVSAILSKYAEVEVSGDARVHPRMPTQVEVELPTQDATAVLLIPHPVNPGDAQRPKLFALDALLQLYRITKITDIDNPPPRMPPQARAEGLAK
jgi:hypothetical protein